MEETIRQVFLEVMLMSLHARLEKASDFIMNTDMKIECDLLSAQTERIKRELQSIRDNR